MNGPENADDEVEVVDLLGDLGERRRLSWQERLAGADRYGALLILITVTIVATVVLDEHQWERLVSVALIGLMLVFAMRTSQAPKSWQWIALAVVPVILVATAFAAARGSEGSTIRAVIAAFVTLLLLAVQVAIVRRLSTHLTISWNTIMGALCVYLLFGMIFSGVYAVAGHLEDGRLFAEHESFTSTDTLYFSLITLTTVGYGDLTMRADPMRITAAMEALLGQIYLITAVALLVGNLGRRRRRPPGEDDR
jgi:Ion channel